MHDRTLPPEISQTRAPSTATRSPSTMSGDTQPASTDIPPLAVPHLPDYTLLHIIGRGGMGVVWRATDTALRRDVAVKFLRDDIPADGRAAERFLEEARITGQLQHPGIPAVHRVGTTPSGRPYLAMKLIRGESLADLLNTKTPVNILAVFEQIAQALGYAHAHGVIHRDLKPANVMVGAFGEVQVMDWGLAKQLRDAELGTQIDEAEGDTLSRFHEARDSDDETRAGSVMGTPAYMPPEQAIGAVDKLSPASDVFGLGGILCAMLAGRPPFVGEDAESTRQLAARAKLDDAFAAMDISDADPALVALCKHCLKVEPQDRPTNGAIVAEAIATIRRESEERAKQAERDKLAAEVRTAEQAKRRRVLQYAAGVVTAVLLAGIIGTAIGLMRANQARDAESEAREAEATRAEGERVAKEKAVAAEQVATKRLTNVEKANTIMASIFENLDPAEIAKAERPLQAILVEKIDEAIKLLDVDSIGDELVVADMQEKLGNSLFGLGKPERAIIVFERCRAIRTAKLGPDHPTTLQCMANLAIGYKLAGKLDRALPLLEESFATMKAKLGQDNPETLASMNNLASGYELAGKLDQALPVYEETFALRKAKLGPNHPETLTSMNNLALGYRLAGNLDRALPLLEETLALRRTVLVLNHPDTLASMNSLAVGYYSAGKHDRALRLFEETLTLRTTKLGRNHPATLTNMNNLAMVYNSAGNFDRALSLYEETLALQKAKLGLDHPDTLVSMNNFARAYQSAGKLDQALPLYEAAATGIANRSYQLAYANSILTNTSSAYESYGQYIRAESWRRKWLAHVKATAGPQSPAYANELAGLALNLINQAKYPDAEATCADCLAIRKSIQPDAWSTFNVQSMLGEALMMQKKFADAEPQLLVGYDGMKAREKQIPPGTNRLREAAERLARFYEMSGQPAKAKEWQAKMPRESAPLPRASLTASGVR